MHVAEYRGYACASTGIHTYSVRPGAARKRRVRSITVRNISFSDLKEPGRTPGSFLLPHNGNRHRSTRRWGWPLTFHTLNTHVGMNTNACAHLARTIRRALRHAREGVAARTATPDATRMHTDGGIGTTSRSEREGSRFDSWSVCTRTSNAGVAEQRRHAAADRDTSRVRVPPPAPSIRAEVAQPVERRCEAPQAAVQVGPSAPCPSSSVAERLVHIEKVVGSTPSSGTNAPRCLVVQG